MLILSDSQVDTNVFKQDKGACKAFWSTNISSMISCQRENDGQTNHICFKKRVYRWLSWVQQNKRKVHKQPVKKSIRFQYFFFFFLLQGVLFQPWNINMCIKSTDFICNYSKKNYSDTLMHIWNKCETGRTNLTRTNPQGMAGQLSSNLYILKSHGYTT